MALTKRNVDSATPSQRDTFVWDQTIKGFGLKVTPSGKKIYVLQKRVKGRLRRFTIGVHGAPWTPDQARSEAVRLLGLVASGVDPAYEKAEIEKSVRVGEFVDSYLAESLTRKKPKTIQTERSLIKRHIKPLIGKREVRSLGRVDVEKFMSDVARGSTAIVEKTAPRGKAIVRGGKGTANRAYDLLSAMFSYSVQSGLRTDNPAAGVKKYRLQRRERLLTDEEIQSIADALVKAEAAGVNQFALAAIRFLLLTGCRKSEALTLQWNWIDLNRGVLRLPDSKTGAKVVPIGQPAVELLRLLPKQKGNPFVFPSTGSNERHFTNIQKVWTDVRRDAGLVGLRIHDLRHHYASVGASSGESLYLIGKILGHSQPHTTQRYAHIASDPVRRSADRISKSILAAIESPQRNTAPDQSKNDTPNRENLDHATDAERHALAG